jgi:hypothetical protein
MNRLIILDINGVLGYKKEGDFIFRDHVKEFLEFCYSYGDVGFFSSTTKKIGYKILEKILTFDQFKKTKFFWYRDHVKNDPDYLINNNINKYDTIKLLDDVISSSSINYERIYGYHNTIIIDDSWNKLRFNNSENCIIVRENDSLLSIVKIIMNKI